MDMVTVQDFQKEVNRWLKTKWQHADFNSELPTMKQTVEYMNTMLHHWEEEYESQFAETIAQQRALNGAPRTRAPISVMTLWSFVSNHVDDVDEIRLVCGAGTNSERTLVHFNCIVKHCEIEDDVGNGVKSISFDETKGFVKQGTTIFSLAVRAEALMTSAFGNDVNERWLAAPDGFRAQFHICPCCQNKIRLADFGDGDDRQAVCDACNWVSHGKYYYWSEITDQVTFRKEINYLKREQKYIKVMEEIMNSLSNALDEMEKAYNGRPKSFPEMDEEYKEKLRKLLKRAGERL